MRVPVLALAAALLSPLAPAGAEPALPPGVDGDTPLLGRFDGGYLGFHGGLSGLDREFETGPNRGLLDQDDADTRPAFGVHAGHGTSIGSLHLGVEADLQIADHGRLGDSLTLRSVSERPIVSGGTGGSIIGAVVGEPA